jgi:Flp pilus assembly protein TadG
MVLTGVSKLRRFQTDDRGSELVEFAVFSSILLMLIFGIMDTSRALYADHYVSSAASQATRYAMVRGSSWSANCTTTSTYSCAATKDNITSFVKAVTPPGFNTSNLTVSTSWPGTTASGANCASTNGDNSPGCVVTVQVQYVFNFILPFLPKNAMTLSSTSSVPISQ